MTSPSIELRQLIPVVNQLFDMEQKLAHAGEAAHRLSRNIGRIRRYLKEMGLSYHSPLGEPYDETRTDCEATIVGESAENLRVTEVIKPLVRVEMNGLSHILQRAVVIVQSEKNKHSK
ncbi:MAG: hypothetical protein D6730_19445 [Bacteroidetes bacterium]|nr:MAG: hypothetical protein D6730_19445 [Bacteroidota bacterium]